jgi:CRP/FNR family transcriptional regulator, dissimilatory nitrate respiration regulator
MMAITLGDPPFNDRERAVLLRLPLLAGVGDDTRDTLLASGRIRTIPARSTVVREGERAHGVFCVLEGHVRLCRLGRDGREADMRVCGPGDSFGECLLLGDDGYHYHAEATEPVVVAIFDASVARDLLYRDPRFGTTVLSLISRNFLGTLDCIASDRLFTAPQKLANYLLGCCPAKEGPISFRLPFQKSLLAGMLGLAPEALSRAFFRLRDAGVTVRGRLIQIEDVAALRDV